MLDFTQVSEPTMEVKMPDGKVLHLLTPDGKLMQRVMKLSNGNVEITDLYQVVTEILNNNKHFIKYDIEEVSALRIPILTKLFESYGNFIKEVQTNPN